MKILVFPANMPEGQAYAVEVSKFGPSPVGASSVAASEQLRKGFSCWEDLPFVTEATFVEKLIAVVRKHHIEAIVSPHAVVWQSINAILPRHLPEIRLLNEHPFDEVLSPLHAAESKQRELRFPASVLTPGSPRLPAWAESALILALSRLPGQSTVEKLVFMANLVAAARPGDMVELGSLWGRSAYAIAMASRYGEAGPLLCVDPWEAQAYHQPQSSELLAAAADRLDPEASFRYFVANLAVFGGRHCNYIRDRSVQAADIYRRSRTILSAPYGSTEYAGEISFLHIDGNHDFAAVAADLDAWTPFLKPGAWIALDDYCWPFGDGPRLAADVWLEDHMQRIDIAFSAFDCLWIRLKD